MGNQRDRQNRVWDRRDGVEGAGVDSVTCEESDWCWCLGARQGGRTVCHRQSLSSATIYTAFLQQSVPLPVVATNVVTNEPR